ncbi:MAG: hypothetical protein H7Y18_16290 [Clostridiaceae bacterium]|nr:hypothetical protein [Clostridiaceae bacterium]
MISIKDIVKPMMGSQSLLLGMGVAAVGYMLAPQLKKSMRPMAVKGTQGVMSLGDMTKRMYDDSKEKITSFMGERSSEIQDNLKYATEESHISSNFLKELVEERNVSNKIMQELKNSIVNLSEEIAQLRKADTVQGS